MANRYEQELELAQACLNGDQSALEYLERKYFSKLGLLVSRVDSDKAFIDEVMQILRVKLLIGQHGKVPKLKNYSGSGSLASWINIVAARIAIDLKRDSAKEPFKGDSHLDQQGRDSENPELRVIREMHREDLSMAFREALKSLTFRERNVLRLHFIDGQSTNKISLVYGVHRVTVARWISSCRAKIAQKTRQNLQGRLNISESQISSIMNDIGSNPELSISLIVADAEKDQ